MDRKPNVIIVITDDQGYGDLGCTGNPWIKTDHIDAFYSASVRMTDFHVSPMCAPTRGALLTGHRPLRNGVWATCWGRSILRKEEYTLADAFKDNGYATGMFGKWHLGDNYPYRPMDRGFERVVAHKGGGVGQTPDFWGNNYNDDTYFHNGEPVEHQGYCTDVWFDEAMSFIEEKKDRPFFAYIATNAPHHPFLVDDRYAAPYRGNPNIPEPNFYGMITNIDDNFGKLRAKLKALAIEENTILIFMTDNGSYYGCLVDKDQFVTTGYNAGMRGFKGSYYDGGHRVPFFIRWPGGHIGGGRDVDDIGFHVDLFPTLAQLCGLELKPGLEFDGQSIVSLLENKTPEDYDRTEFVQYRQYTEPPRKWENAVLTGKWRLINGIELYDITADPGQRHNVASQFPEVVSNLRQAHEAWWDQISDELDAYSPISLGADEENPTRLDAMDVMGDVAWCQAMVAAAQKCTGKWAVNVERKGRYKFELKRWPEELDLPIDASIGFEEASKLAPHHPIDKTRAIHPVRARIKIFDTELSVPVWAGSEEAVLTLETDQTGETVLEAWFTEADGTETGAYYVYVIREN